jgi:hypothetical protein
MIMKTITTHRLMRLKILLLIAVLILKSIGAEKTNKVGTAAATFLRIPVGARAVGMGSSFVSMSNDPTGLFWNPSMLSSIQTNAMVFDHSPWLPGITFDFMGIVLPIENIGTIGISTTIVGTEDMLVTTYDDQMGESGETFAASDLAVGISYSKSLTDKFAIGGTFKYIRQTIWESYASGIAFDVGTIFETPLEGIRLGVSIANFGTKMQMTGGNLNVRVDIAPDQEGNNQNIVGKINTDEFDLPLIMRIGISGEVVKTENYRFTLSADAINPNDNAQSVNLGGEMGLLNDMILLRAGYRDLFLEENEFGATFGVSLNNIEVITGVTVSTEYAYQQYIHLGDSNRFTLGIRF